jgi:hypothetical protein
MSDIPLVMQTMYIVSPYAGIAHATTGGEMEIHLPERSPTRRARRGLLARRHGVPACIIFVPARGPLRCARLMER